MKRHVTQIIANDTQMVANATKEYLRRSVCYLRKFVFKYFSLIIFFTLTGCITEYNLATRQQETLLYGREKEISIGESVAHKIAEKYEFVHDEEINERVEQILDRLVEVCDRKELIYFIKVIDEDIMNAVSLPGGYIYLYRGLIDRVDSDDQLAGVIAHEIAHITAKHGVKRLQAFYGAMALQVLAAETDGNLAMGVNLALNSLFTEHSQHDEFQADELAVKYMKKAGYDPQAMVIFLEKLREEQEKYPTRKYSYWRTHPYIAQRIGIVNKEITGQIDFRGYLNLTGNE